jgi:receptor protein-tyrosine kinase
MGQILVVVEADKTTHRVLSNALTTIQSCPLVTTILNKATSRSDAGYYYYAA